MTDLENPTPTGDRESQRLAAIAFVMEAFDAARDAGIGTHELSRAALFQAIMRMVDEIGEEAAARFLHTSATGVQRGYYSRSACDLQSLN
ncbi:MAG: hypothetical protein AAGH60_15490 [Pseudomonadota bacterium]